MATVLVTQGTLKSGQNLVCGTAVAKVKKMVDSADRPMKAATPATPVQVAGWKVLPHAGDHFHCVESEVSVMLLLAVFARIHLHLVLDEQCCSMLMNARTHAAVFSVADVRCPGSCVHDMAWYMYVPGLQHVICFCSP